MTILNENMLNYIIIKNDEYFLKDDTPNDVKEQIKLMIDNFKKLYNQNLIIHIK